MFRCVRKHLAPGGTCILNVFNPNRDRQSLRQAWCRDTETQSWEVLIEGVKITCHDRRPRMDAEKLILYPELICRRYEGEVLKDEAVLKLVMRCYYPDDFEQLVTAHGFKIIDRWGGYAGEVYGKGPELVIQFAEGSQHRDEDVPKFLPKRTRVHIGSVQMSTLVDQKRFTELLLPDGLWLALPDSLILEVPHNTRMNPTRLFGCAGEPVRQRSFARPARRLTPAC